jgi:hypothetical protein
MEILFRLLSLIPHIIVLIATLSYLSAHRTAEAYLMVAGACVGILISVFYTVLFPFLASTDQWRVVEPYLGMISLVGTIGAFAFAIGFLMHIRKGRTEA